MQTLRQTSVGPALAPAEPEVKVNIPQSLNSYRTGPDERGHFGTFGGRFVAETLMPLILELEQAYEAAKSDPAYAAELAHLGAHYTGRPSPLYYAERLTEHFRQVAAADGRSGGAKIYFKRDELNHTGSHKINNCLGQILLARRMGKTRIIAETGAGQHGVATATVCARFGLPCVIFMGATDVERQKPNVFRMKLLGADVRPVTSPAPATLKDAIDEALRDWVAERRAATVLPDRHAAPAAHPLPRHGARLQSVIGDGGQRADAGQARRAGIARRAGRGDRRRLQRHRPCSTRSSTTRTWRLRRRRPAATASTWRTATPPP
jgi:tryptophan synthase beta chain